MHPEQVKAETHLAMTSNRVPEIPVPWKRSCTLDAILCPALLDWSHPFGIIQKKHFLGTFYFEICEILHWKLIEFPNLAQFN